MKASAGSSPKWPSARRIAAISISSWSPTSAASANHTCGRDARVPRKAGERLEPDHLLGREIDDGLECDAEGIVGEQLLDTPARLDEARVLR